MRLLIGDPLLVIGAAVQGEVETEGQKSHAIPSGSGVRRLTLLAAKQTRSRNVRLNA